MLFNSLHFLLFFPIVLLICFILPAKIRYLWLLISSYYFYMCWDAKYALLLLFSTLVTWVSGLGIDWCKKQDWAEEKKIKRKKLCVLLSVLLNIGVLCYFKYTNFLLENLQAALGTFGITLNLPEFSIVLPVGISFFTFQALSYTLDVYREEIYAEKNFFRYALFVSFFPQLVAGPIERSKNLLKQLAAPARFKWENAREGILLMLWGFFLKMVLADRAAIFVDRAYGNHTQYTGGVLLVASLLFAIQVYCDFYGYSVIATGAAKILGYDLMDNFNAPFFASTVADLWRRWHISLNSWFRDYLYIPLGGNKKGKVRKYINMFIVFFTSGLWHGANWTYVVWGVLNGIYQMVGQWMMPVRDKLVWLFRLDRNSYSHKLMKVLVTFLLFDFSVIFFRATSVKEACEIIRQIAVDFGPAVLVDGSLYTCGLDQKNFTLMIYSIILLFLADFFKYKGVRLRDVLIRQEYWFQWLVMAGGIVFIVLTGIWGSAYEATNFIYFQF
ncbi:MAG: MBOAT family protein [Lachnospiraceae bacterium]|nr:MBOAT family protein [Lachnospiraceae bacterium]